jgi:hypothetical protein
LRVDARRLESLLATRTLGKPCLPRRLAATKAPEVAPVTLYAADKSAAGWRLSAHWHRSVQSYGQSPPMWGSDGSSANAVKRWPTGGLVFRKQRRKALTRKRDDHRRSSSVRENALEPPWWMRFRESGRAPDSDSSRVVVVRSVGCRGREKHLSRRTWEAERQPVRGGIVSSRRPNPGRGAVRFVDDDKGAEGWSRTSNTNASNFHLPVSPSGMPVGSNRPKAP